MNFDLTIWTVRIACMLYVGALLAWRFTKPQAAKACWTMGLAAYLAHVVAAFAYRHSWSHEAAWLETARQTSALFGLDWGGGLWFNYVFTLVWLFDAAWLWIRPESYRLRTRAVSIPIHAFMAFMFFNGAVVFASGWVRWLGAAATATLILLHALRPRR